MSRLWIKDSSARSSSKVAVSRQRADAALSRWPRPPNLHLSLGLCLWCSAHTHTHTAADPGAAPAVAAASIKLCHNWFSRFVLPLGTGREGEEVGACGVQVPVPSRHKNPRLCTACGRQQADRTSQGMNAPD